MRWSGNLSPEIGKKIKFIIFFVFYFHEFFRVFLQSHKPGWKWNVSKSSYLICSLQKIIFKIFQKKKWRNSKVLNVLKSVFQKFSQFTKNNPTNPQKHIKNANLSLFSAKIRLLIYTITLISHFRWESVYDAIAILRIGKRKSNSFSIFNFFENQNGWAKRRKDLEQT